MARGADAKAFRNTGTWASPTWAELEDVSDFASNLSWEQISLATRACKINLYEPGQGELEIPFKIRVSTGADYLAIIAAVQTRARLDVMILDGPLAENSRGFRAQFYVFQKNQDQALASGLFDDLILKPAVPDDPSRLPQYVSVGAAAAVTYTGF